MVAAIETAIITGVYGFLVLARRASGTRPSTGAKSLVMMGVDITLPWERIFGFLDCHFRGRAAGALFTGR